MNMTCPHCKHPIPYDHNQAGHRVSCSSCKQPVAVPQLKALPPEYQEEYREEVEKARKKQEADLRKQQNAELHRQQAERDEAERALRAVENQRRRGLQAEDNQRQLEQIRLETEQDAREKAKWKANVNAAVHGVPEEAAITNRYPALQVIVSIIKAITVAGIIIILLGSVGTCVMQAKAAPLLALLSIGGGAFMSVILWVVGFAQAELILLAIDIANDMRINRLLLKGIRYNKKE